MYIVFIPSLPPSPLSSLPLSLPPSPPPPLSPPSPSPSLPPSLPPSPPPYLPPSLPPPLAGTTTRLHAMLQRVSSCQQVRMAVISSETATLTSESSLSLSGEHSTLISGLHLENLARGGGAKVENRGVT